MGMHKCFNAFTGETLKMPTSPTLHQLREPSKYWVISDAQLKRDLRLDGYGRTLKDVYRENRALRGVEGKYVPVWQSGVVSGGGCFGDSLYGGETIEGRYLTWCKARNHTPHPASIDSDHPMHAGQREKCPKREIVS